VSSKESHRDTRAAATVREREAVKGTNPEAGTVLVLRDGLPFLTTPAPSLPAPSPPAATPTVESVTYDVCTRNLTKGFSTFKAVNNLSLRVKHGEIYGLLGPNGAGKTTVIKILCGLLHPSSGEAYVLGAKVPAPSVVSRIGYMPQELALYHGVTVHQNIAFYGKVFGLSKRQIETRERELLKLIDLEAAKDLLVDQLSGGMQHRVSLACTLLHQPKLLFLDEPTIGVDPTLRASFWDYFEKLRDAGVTMVVTTHYMDEARHCDRIGFMCEGRIIAEGTPSELLALTHTESLEDAFSTCSKSEGSR
jgi:ABC-2 type transport system ATP-binding protein